MTLPTVGLVNISGLVILPSRLFVPEVAGFFSVVSAGSPYSVFWSIEFESWQFSAGEFVFTLSLILGICGKVVLNSEFYQDPENLPGQFDCRLGVRAVSFDFANGGRQTPD
ncbi:MAG: hypothetical protein LBP22_07980 [Deltaproteobacteria bacterium]|jgi:hypothetical protein|nr:hypothetical protein [Deltaproteobacteria bacterium]